MSELAVFEGSGPRREEQADRAPRMSIPVPLAARIARAHAGAAGSVARNRAVATAPRSRNDRSCRDARVAARVQGFGLLAFFASAPRMRALPFETGSKPSSSMVTFFALSVISVSLPRSWLTSQPVIVPLGTRAQT